MEKLTSKEQIVLQKIREYLAHEQKITVRALQEDLGYASPRSISVLLAALIDKGWIYRDSQDQIRISPDYRSESYDVQMVPLIGAIACGMPIFAEENIETQIPISSKFVTGGSTYFFLRAQGDSMNQKGIQDGDLVLVRQTNYPENGKIVVALINDEATLKEFHMDQSTIYLIPHSDNPRHKPIILDDSDGNISIQ
jgi:repressor LexA